MALLDIVVFLLIGGFGIRGLLSGFVKESLALCAIFAGILAVRFLHAPVTAFLTRHISNEYGAALLAFILLFGTVYVGGKMLAGTVGKHTRSSALGSFDRVLGLGFGAVKGLLIATVGFVGFSIVYDALYGDVATRPEWIRQSRSYPLLNASGQAMSAWLSANSQDGGLLGGASTPKDEPKDKADADADADADAEPTS